MADGVKPAVVRIFTAPESPCGTGMTWTSAVDFVRDRLRRRFGERVVVEHVEAFTRRSLDFPAVLGAIEGGSPLPIVLVEDRIVSQGGKLSDALIARSIDAPGARATGQPGRER